MSVNKKFSITLISILIIVLLSLFYFINEYREKITNATITRQQLALLEIMDVFTSTDQRLAQLDASKDHQAWLHLAKLHADTSAITGYQLGEYFRQQPQMQLAKLWYQVAIRQGHEAARIALANIYFEQQYYADIKPLLLPIITNARALALLYKLAMQQGDIAFIEAYKFHLAQGENAALYLELAQFSVFSSTSVSQLSGPNISTKLPCLVDVQLFATNLTGLRHGQQLISTFEHHQLANYICLQTPKYIAADALNCQHLAIESINCNATVWMNRQDINSRYLGIIVEQGNANVDNGIMYIDQQDNLDVLVHELSHFIGFVDEYPLPRQHQKCHQLQQAPFAHNLVVLPDYYQGERDKLREYILSQVPWGRLIKDSTPILTQYQHGWQLVTPAEYQDEIGLYASASCDKQNHIQAFKPLLQRTKLEYFELLFPQEYFDIIKLAPRDYLMPSYHFNVSRDLAKQGDYAKARDVLLATQFD